MSLMHDDDVDKTANLVCQIVSMFVILLLSAGFGLIPYFW